MVIKLQKSSAAPQPCSCAMAGLGHAPAGLQACEGVLGRASAGGEDVVDPKAGTIVAPEAPLRGFGPGFYILLRSMLGNFKYSPAQKKQRLKREKRDQTPHGRVAMQFKVVLESVVAENMSHPN